MYTVIIVNYNYYSKISVYITGYTRETGVWKTLFIFKNITYIRINSNWSKAKDKIEISLTKECCEPLTKFHAYFATNHKNIGLFTKKGKKNWTLGKKIWSRLRKGKILQINNS